MKFNEEVRSDGRSEVGEVMGGGGDVYGRGGGGGESITEAR